MIQKQTRLRIFLVTLQTKAMKACPDPAPTAVAPIDAHAVDVAAEQARFDQETARRAEIIRSAQEARCLRQNKLDVNPLKTCRDGYMQSC